MNIKSVVPISGSDRFEIEIEEPTLTKVHKSLDEVNRLLEDEVKMRDMHQANIDKFELIKAELEKQ